VRDVLCYALCDDFVIRIYFLFEDSCQGKFERTKPHVNVGTIGTWTTEDDVDGGADEGVGGPGLATYVTYDQVAKASESQGRRDATKILTIATSHVEYATANRHYAHVDSRVCASCHRRPRPR